MSRLVSVDATHTFVIRGVYARSIHRQELTDQEIHDCLMQQTSVTEHLPNGIDRKLDLSNYKTQVKVEEKKTTEPEVKETEHVAPVETHKVEEKKITEPEVKETEQPAQKDKSKQTFKKANKK